MNNWLNSKEFRNKYRISSATLWRMDSTTFKMG